jgi:hypothetical protein
MVQLFGRDLVHVLTQELGYTPCMLEVSRLRQLDANATPFICNVRLLNVIARFDFELHGPAFNLRGRLCL